MVSLAQDDINSTRSCIAIIHLNLELEAVVCYVNTPTDRANVCLNDVNPKSRAKIALQTKMNSIDGIKLRCAGETGL